MPGPTPRRATGGHGEQENTVGEGVDAMPLGWDGGIPAGVEEPLAVRRPEARAAGEALQGGRGWRIVFGECAALA